MLGARRLKSGLSTRIEEERKKVDNTLCLFNEVVIVCFVRAVIGICAFLTDLLK